MLKNFDEFFLFFTKFFNDIQLLYSIFKNPWKVQPLDRRIMCSRRWWKVYNKCYADNNCADFSTQKENKVIAILFTLRIKNQKFHSSFLRFCCSNHFLTLNMHKPYADILLMCMHILYIHKIREYDDTDWLNVGRVNEIRNVDEILMLHFQHLYLYV